MNYQNIYNQLITKRQQNPITKKDCYCESHHIIPKSLNGTNDGSNKVNLTAREHYIAHLLLVKIMEQKFGKESKEYEKMTCALWRFIYDNETNTIINSHKYEKIKRIFSKMQSKRVSGSNNGMFGRKGKLSPVYGTSPFKNFSSKRMEEYKLKQRLSHLGKKPWNKGLYGIQKVSIETRQKLSKANSGINNPMYGHSVTEYMSDEKIKLWKQHLSEAGKRRKPASIETRKKLSQSNKGKKRTNEQRKHISEKHWKPKGYKHMYNPITFESKLVSPDKFDYFLSQ